MDQKPRLIGDDIIVFAYFLISSSTTQTFSLRRKRCIPNGHVTRKKTNRRQKVGSKILFWNMLLSITISIKTSLSYKNWRPDNAFAIKSSRWNFISFISAKLIPILSYPEMSKIKTSSCLAVL